VETAVNVSSYFLKISVKTHTRTRTTLQFFAEYFDYIITNESENIKLR